MMPGLFMQVAAAQNPMGGTAMMNPQMAAMAAMTASNPMLAAGMCGGMGGMQQQQMQMQQMQQQRMQQMHQQMLQQQQMQQQTLQQQQMHQQMLIQRMHEDFSSQQWQAPLLPMHNKRIHGPLARSGDESSGLTDDSCRSLVRRQSSMSTPTGENAVMKRSIQSLLNKVCPENVGTILQNVAALNVKETSHLEILVDLIFNKALAEPHYCETYADLAFGLTAVLPEFSRPAGQGGPAVTLRSVLLGACQREFENLLAAMDEQTSDMDPEEIDALRKSRRDRLRANTRLIGALFLRKLLATKVVGRLCCELTNCSSDQPPEEHAVECVCELLNSVGLTLESHPAGAEVIEQVCQRLKSLKDQKHGDSKTGIYCKRVQFTIQDLLDTRGAGWSKISFKSAAKTKEEIRQQQERDEVMAKCSSNKHVVTPGAEKVLVGQRPSYLNFGAVP
mmetsp:Transcript_15959/g.44153  ORF Transcript_15959/g.44153 Transcript_15959/m.44153 type:complete len:447 (+) Transcript_15959:2-1342(+)